MTSASPLSSAPAPEAAARRFWWLAQEAKRLQLTGVQFKDRSDAGAIAATAASPSLSPPGAALPD
jgi:hypothetical protein